MVSLGDVFLLARNQLNELRGFMNNIKNSCFNSSLRTMIVSMALYLALALLGTTQASINQFVAGMSASGTAAFDSGTCTPNGTAYTPGEDVCGADNIIRTHDYATYRVGYTITPSDTNALLRLEIGAIVLPGSYTGLANPRVAYFDMLDLPTGANGCRNISPTPLAGVPAVGTSGVSKDGKTLYCYQPTPVSGNNLDFRMRIAGDAPNGTTVAPPTITFGSTSNPASNVLVPGALTGSIGAETFYGMPNLLVSAAPRWDLVKGSLRGGLFVPKSGPAGEDGYVFSWNIGIKANGSRKGLEALSSAGWVENYSDLSPLSPDTGADDYPNAKLVAWDMQNPGFISTNVTSAASNGNPRHCGDWQNQLTVLGNTFDNTFYFPTDSGKTATSLVYSVAKGGECVMTPGTNNTTTKTATFELIGTDYSLAQYPTKKGYNPAATILVNSSNLDSASNEWWVASKTILVWAPLTDIVVPPSPKTEYITNQATLSGTSVSGQANADPLPGNDVSAVAATRQLAGNLSKGATTWQANNPDGRDTLTVCDPGITGNCLINQASPGQYYSTYFHLNNTGTEDYPVGYLCDKFDNARLSMVDITSPAFTPTSGAQLKDPNTGIIVRWLSGTATTFPISWELGVGGTGITPAPSAGGAGANSGTWTSTNTVTSEYTGPSAAGASQGSGSLCADSDATWFSSISALESAGYTLQDVSRIRGKYPSFPASNAVIILIPTKANTTVAFDTSMGAPGVAHVAPGTPVLAGTATANTMTTNQAVWNKDGINYAHTSDAVRIFQNEFAQITKSSPTHLNNSLVTVGARVTYNLTVNLSSSGSAHPTDVQVYDMLPANMTYIAGSSKLGGAALPDPACNVGPAVWPAGYAGAPSPSTANDIPAGYTLCRWSLSNQLVTKSAPGAASANLPVLAFEAGVNINASNGTPLLNTAFADSATNSKYDPRYNGATAGFQCLAGQSCSFSNWQLSVSATPGAIVGKTLDKSLIPTNTGFTYGLEYGAIGNSLADFRLIDRLPYNGDSTLGRSPASAYQGTLGLASAVATPAQGLGGTSNDPDVLVYYTSNPQANISIAPFDASHDLSGASNNSSTKTNWCTWNGSGFSGTGTCPANLAAVTGVYVRAKGGTAPVAAGEQFRLELKMLPSGNAAGDVYSNSYVADSPSLTARQPGSNLVSTTVVSPDLIISKTANAAAILAGDAVDYTLIARNNTGALVGPIEATPAPNITVTDPLPANLTMSGTPTGVDWDCSASTSTQVACAYTGTVPLGVGAAIGGPITFSAVTASTTSHNSGVSNEASIVMTGQAETVTTNNKSTVIINVKRKPDLAISKSVNKTILPVESTATWTLAVTNLSGADVGPVDSGSGIRVTDPIPAQLTISAAPTGTNWDCSASTTTLVDCTYTGTFPIVPGNAVGGDITLSTTVVANSPSGETLNNEATLVLAGQTDKNAANNKANASTVTKGQPDMLVTTSVDKATLQAGENAVWTLVASNNSTATTGAVDAGSVVRIQAALPAHLTISTAPAGAGWNCSASTTTNVDCTYSGTLPLAAGSQMGAITFTTLVDAVTPDASPLTVAADVSLTGQTEARTDNNAGSASITVNGNPDLVLDVQVDKANAFPDDTLTWVLHVSSQSAEGTAPLAAGSAIRVKDTLPAGLSITTAPTGVDWDCSASVGNVIDCTYTGSLPLAQGNPIGGDITFTTTIAANTPDNTVINNTAQVSLSGQGEPNTSNNNSTASVTVNVRKVDLSLKKTVDKAVVASGQTVTYTLTLKNDSDNAASNVQVADKLPDELEWVSDSSGGNYSSSTGIWQVGTVDANSQQVLTITVRIK